MDRLGGFISQTKGIKCFLRAHLSPKDKSHMWDLANQRTVSEQNVVKEKLPESHLRAKNYVSQAANGQIVRL